MHAYLRASSGILSASPCLVSQCDGSSVWLEEQYVAMEDDFIGLCRCGGCTLTGGSCGQHTERVG